MVKVPAGNFVMGDLESKHSVYLNSFYIGKFLVTNAEYKLFVDASGRTTRPRYWKGGTFPEGKANTFREETRRPEAGYHSVGFRTVALAAD